MLFYIFTSIYMIHLGFFGNAKGDLKMNFKFKSEKFQNIRYY